MASDRSDSGSQRLAPAEIYSRANLPGVPLLWPTYRKATLTNAIRVDGPFTVETSEGIVACEDGYLAVDARGYPYPIAADEFELIYEPSDDAGRGRQHD